MENKIIEFFKQTMILIFIVIVVGVGGQIIKELLFESKPSQQEINKNLINEIKAASEKENARGPRMINGDTRLDKTVAGPGLSVTSYMSTPEIESRVLLLAKDGTFNHVKAYVCSNESMKGLLIRGVAFNYIYRGSDNTEAYRISISREDCR
jgi:hypothetical protein